MSAVAQSMVGAANRALTRRARTYSAVIPPENAEHVFQSGTVACTTNGTALELLAFTVEPGSLFRLTGLLVTYVGVDLRDALGQAPFTLDVDVPTSIGAGVTALVLPSGYAVQGFDSFDFHLGSLDYGVWKIPGPLLFDPSEVLRLKVTTASPFPETGVTFISMFEGWTWPQQREDL